MTIYQTVHVGLCIPPRKDGRGDRPPANIESMGRSLQHQGQLSPLLLYRDGDAYVTVDGWTRVLSARWAGIETLDAVVLEKPPSAADELIIMATIDAHRVDFSAIEKSRLLIEIQKQTQCGPSALAEKLCLSQAQVSKLLAVEKLVPAVREQLADGRISLEKAYICSQEPDPVRQLELANSAGSMDRSELRRRAKGARSTEAIVKTPFARFQLSGGIRVVMQGRSIDLHIAIESLGALLKELKRAEGQSLDIATVQLVLADKAKSAKLSPA